VRPRRVARGAVRPAEAAEQIIGTIREAKVGLAQGQTEPGMVRKLGVTEQTSGRWKRG